MQLTLAQVLEATGAQIIHGSIEPKRCISGWSIDSRTVEPGDLFFAIKGDVHDGHAFVPKAFERGAVAAVVSSYIAAPPGVLLRNSRTTGLESSVSPEEQASFFADWRRAAGACTLLKTDDPLGALQRLAHWARKQWGGKVIAVTGSAGKTSTKDIIASFLGTRFRTGKTIGNFNNHIGLPLSLLRLPEEAEIAVIELGMNHAGEIRDLARIAEPEVGVVTNVGYAHVEAFDSIEGVALAKRELIEELPESGTAVLNADDERVLAFRSCRPGTSITYGFSEQADLRAVQVEGGPSETEFTVHGVRFRTALTGRHSVLNLLAGLATAKVFAIGVDELVPLVESLRATKMRGERSVRNGITTLNDSYNSNPEAARSMIDVLRAEPAQRRIAVLGEMLELGHMAEVLHRNLGSYVADAGVDVLVGVCGVSRLMVEQAKRAGLDNHTAFFFEDAETAGDFLRDFVRPGDAILFKGSRGIHVEKAIERMEQ